MEILKTPESNAKTVFPSRGTDNCNSVIIYSMIQVFLDC